MQIIFAPRKPDVACPRAISPRTPAPNPSGYDPDMAKDPYKVEFGRRLRLIATERECHTAESIAAVVGATRAAVDTWLNGRALPKWEQAAKLADAWHVTLDWLFRGKPDGLPHSVYIRIMALESGMQIGEAGAPSEAQASAVPAKAARRKAVSAKASAAR
jgi:transcriptional regulator with XRE-family HTH domain